MDAVGMLLLDQLRSLSIAESVAVTLAVAYLLLVIRQNIWCWACAAISSAIYVWLFIDARLYMESLLYLFYVTMAVYGWYVWIHVGSDEAPMPVTRWGVRVHAIALACVALLAALSGWLLSEYSNAAYPYIDSLTTFAAIWATFLVTRKVFENWWYWLAIDLVSIVIYWARDLQLTALLFVIYVALIPLGLLQWRQSLLQQAANER